LYHSGFTKQRIDDDDEKESRSYLVFDTFDEEEYRLDATDELLYQYQESYAKSKGTAALLKSMKFYGSDTDNRWDHIFDESAHGKDITDKTIGTIRKICESIIGHEHNLQHKARSLNLKKLRERFGCKMPIYLLLEYGFTEREDVYRNEIRLEFKEQSVAKIREMYQKLKYHEKLRADRNVFSAMSDNMQTVWIHSLSSIHGVEVQKTTVSTLRKIASAIIRDPANPKNRDLGYAPLSKKFGCGTPIALLKGYGFVETNEFWRSHGKQRRLKYESSDITPLHEMVRVLEIADKMDHQNKEWLDQQSLRQHGGRLLPILDVLKRVREVQDRKEPDLRAQSASDNLNNLSSLLQGLSDAQSMFGGGIGGGLGGGISAIDDERSQRILSAFDGQTMGTQTQRLSRGGVMEPEEDSDGGKENEDDDRFVTMERLLWRADPALSKYTLQFMDNGVDSEDALRNVPEEFVAIIIPNAGDQRKFLDHFGRKQ